MKPGFAGSYFPLANAVFLATLRENKGRALLSVVGIALGVALGIAIDAINRSALAEFSRAARALSGDADVEIRGGDDYAEAVYPLIARLPQVAAASPVVEAEVRLADNESGKSGASLRIIGIDPFRVARLRLAFGDGDRGDSGGSFPASPPSQPSPVPGLIPAGAGKGEGVNRGASADCRTSSLPACREGPGRARSRLTSVCSLPTCWGELEWGGLEVVLSRSFPPCPFREEGVGEVSEQGNIGNQVRSAQTDGEEKSAEAGDRTSGSSALDLLRDDAIYLSAAAARELGLSAGDPLRVQVGLAAVTLHVAAIDPALPGRIGVMDIASAQWRLQRLGLLSRIDVRLRSGEDVEDFIAAVQPTLPDGVHALQPQQLEERGAAASRAYRVNLNMLALVALFTGGFLVFSTQALLVVRRRAQFAILRALGLTRRQLISLLLAEAALIGAVGVLTGILLGLALAAVALRFFGVDLGSGYFEDLGSLLRIEPWAVGAFAVLGIIVALLGSLAPALESAATRPAVALHSSADDKLAAVAPAWLGLALIALGAIAALSPPINGLPLFGYLAIALILLGAIVLMPRFSVLALRGLRASHPVEFGLAIARLRNTPDETATSLAAILVSFSLVVAMAIMVASFRESLDDWLRQVLPAELYLHAGRGSDTAYFDSAQQARIIALPGIARVDFLSVHEVALDPAQPPVALIARPIPTDGPGNLLPLQGPSLTLRAEEPPPVWISEAVQDIYGYKIGDVITLPIAGNQHRFTIAGIWRDYVRQHGAIVLARERYIELTGDRNANQAALWLAPGHRAAEVKTSLQGALPDTASLEISAPNEIRARSLELFDRSFAITYALEAVAIVVGLFGVANGFSAAIAARRREFGVLRHVGMLQRQIRAMLATEAALLAALGAIAGLTLGFVISLILIHVVNRQSFRWSMELHVPWMLLGLLTVSLLVAATVTALISARRVALGDSVSAVREDW